MLLTRNGWTSRFALILIGCAAGLLAAEGVCRLWVPRLDFENLKVKNWPNPEIFRPSSILPFELAPNIPHFSNSLGMRDKERAIAKPAKTSRIIFLGDSIAMYGHFIDMMDQRLGRLFPGLYEVWNCSVGGFGIRDYAVMMLEKIPRYKPDLVVVAFCLNDLDATPVMYYDTKGQLNCYWPIPGIPTALDFWLYKHSYAYRRYLEARAKLRANDPPWDAIATGEKSLSIMERESARMGAPLRAVVFPWLKPDAEWSADERRSYRNITALLKGRRIPYLDLLKTYPSARRRDFRRDPEDPIHTNEAGDRLAAAAILRFLGEQGFVPRK